MVGDGQEPKSGQRAEFTQTELGQIMIDLLGIYFLIILNKYFCIFLYYVREQLFQI